MTRVRRRLGNRVLVPFNFSGAGQFDDDEDFEVFLAVPEAISLIDEFGVWARFREFTAPAQAAASSGQLTSDSGGGATSGSGGGSTPTSSSESAHRHRWARVNGTSGQAPTATKYDTALNAAGTATQIWLEPYTGGGAASDLYTYDANGAHSHTVTVPSHTHSTPNHSHDIAGHGHALTYGIFKEALPGSFNVTLTVFRRPLDLSDPWTQVAAVTMTEQEQSLDLAALMSDEQLGPGLFRLVFLSNGGQPNGGRLGIDVMGWAMGSIASV